MTQSELSRILSTEFNTVHEDFNLSISGLLNKEILCYSITFNVGGTFEFYICSNNLHIDEYNENGGSLRTFNIEFNRGLSEEQFFNYNLLFEVPPVLLHSNYVKFLEYIKQYIDKIILKYQQLRDSL